VRVGPYIGRISDINDRLFIVDFEHPLGGRELACEVAVHRANESIDQVMDSVSVSSERKTEIK
jgi:FKBP-type peptidyl-prolyl cis-trans isomerase 2